jgi:NAD(P)H-hydrate epimerase
VVLKGHRTLIGAPDGRVAVNSTGNPGMATAGTGDVLTGMIGAFLARGMEGWDAARLAAYLHGDAGDRAASDLGPDGLIAGDLVSRIPESMKALLTQDSPSSW